MKREIPHEKMLKNKDLRVALKVMPEMLVARRGVFRSHWTSQRRTRSACAGVEMAPLTNAASEFARRVNGALEG